MYAHQLRIASRVGLGLGVAALVRSNSNSNSTTISKPTRCETAQHQQQLRRPSSQQQTYFDHALDDREKDTAGFVGVFLDAASVKRVQNAVGGSLGRNAHALVQLHPEPGVKRSFAPLFGSKAEVVVRGVAEDVSTRQKVIIVDVNVGGGRLYPSRNGHGSIPTIAMASESWDDDVADLLGVDLARRLLENGILHAKGSWDGVLPGQLLDGIKYPPTRAVFQELDAPVACEGTICASTDYDKQSDKCIIRADTASGMAEKSQDEAEEVEGECPLCTYMMNSPCKDVFVVFKSCIDKAGSTDEREDLTRCEASAAFVHECIQNFGLFREHLQEEAEEAAEISDEGKA
ncbi:GCK domain-containing protein [Nannochloropsis gaditana]|uniref:GCK domain-containing protein n=1 Tax=Nannochloropsis gaditana TaxID=72520 RepID=W7TEE8_9STRA|nr:GCK domain-containing protein [Nannochloropsis gaditana]